MTTTPTTTRTQYYAAASLDGYIADGDGRLDWLFQFDDAEGVKEHYGRFMSQVGALVMGARTYDFVLAQGGAWPYASLPTWVFTHRERPVPPGADVRFTSDDVRAVHARMVEEARGRNLWMVGGGHLAAQFLAHGLLDELHLGIAPVFLGGGAPVLPASVRAPLVLAGVKHFGKGFVELRYEFRKGDAR